MPEGWRSNALEENELHVIQYWFYMFNHSHTPRLIIELRRKYTWPWSVKFFSFSRMISSLTLNSQIKFKCVLPISFPLLQIFCVPRTTSSLSLQAGLADWTWLCSPPKTALPKSILFHHMVSAAAFGGSVHSRVSHPNCMKRGKTLGMWFVISRLL